MIISGMITSIIWSFLEQGGSKLIQLVIQLVMARILSPEAFGILAILLVFISLADSIAQSGLGMALIQRNSADIREYSTAFWLSLGLATLMYTALWFAAPAVAFFYKQFDLELLLRVLGLVVFFNSINSIQRSILQIKMEFKKIFKTSCIAMLLSGLLGITAAVLGFGIWALVVQVLCLGLFTCIAFLLVVPRKPMFYIDWSSAKGMYCYGWKICVTGILNVFYSGVSELIIGKVCSVTDLGFYSQGRKWPNAAISLINNGLQNVFFPVFSSLKGKSEEFVATVKRALVSGTYITAPLALFFAVASEPTVDLLLGQQWLPCVPVFQSICVSCSLTLVQIVNLRAYMALGDSGLYMRLQIIKVVLSVMAIGFAAIVTRNINIVAWVTAGMSILAVLFIDMQPAKRMYGYARLNQLKDIAPIFFLSGLSCVIIIFFNNFVSFSSFFTLMLNFVLFFGIYFFSSWVLKLSGLRDCLVIIRKIIKK